MRIFTTFLVATFLIHTALPAPALSAGSADATQPSARATSIVPTSVLERISAMPRLRSLLVSIDGELVEEHYFNGARAGQPANLKSASKSVLSALIGIALDRGAFKSLNDTVGMYLSDQLSAADDPQKKSITIEHLLTMRSGLESTSNVNYGRWVQSGNWVRYVLARPVVERPGETMVYSTGSSHLLSAMLTKASKMTTFEFARRYLAEPLGVPLQPWARDPQGIYFGGNEMHWTPRGMLAFGQLYLNGGRVGDKRIVSQRWIEESFKPRTRSHWSGREYGYGWWIDTFDDRRSYYAWGHGGQFIFLVPAVRLVVVTTSTPLPGDGRREHQRGVYELLQHELIPAAQAKRAAMSGS
jgi:CubicO group peptidase (beta-lactamase class C family)